MIVSNHLRKLTRVLNASVSNYVFFGYKLLFTEKQTMNATQTASTEIYMNAELKSQSEYYI